jgi:hypothetical protein
VSGGTLRQTREPFSDPILPCATGRGQPISSVAVISRAQIDRVQGFVEHGRRKGAEVVAGGEFGDGGGASPTPTVLAKVARESIFDR